MVEFRVLGPVEVLADDGTSLGVGGPKPRAILALLLLASGPLSRDRLIDELWGDDPPPTAASALHVHLTTLRRALRGRLVAGPAGYAIAAGDDEVDARRFEAAVARSRDPSATALGPAAVAATLRDALDLWRGAALGGVHPTRSLAAAASRLDELRLETLERRVDADLALGRETELVAELTGIVSADPGRERLAGQLMLALHRSGRSADALGVYDATCVALDEHLGVDPGDELVALAKAIRRGDPTLSASVPGLPTPASSFVGREREIEEAAELAGRTRLLAITGPGGCGKTRLALEVVRRLAPSHPGGVHAVELERLPRSGSVAQEVAAAAGARELSGRDTLDAIVDRLGGSRALLVLDGCEHVVGQCGALASHLLQALPGLRIVASSRIPLGVDGETVLALAGLDVPRDNLATARMRAIDSIRLLDARLASARAGHGLDDAELADAAALCRQLDGLPLALELAAARARSMSIRDVVRRLRTRLDLLARPAAESTRHTAMSQTIAWSHDLLDADERAAYRRLAVVVGAADLEMIEAVVAGPAGAPTAERCLDIVASLADQSLVVADVGVVTRYRMLGVIRQHAAEQLEIAGETALARRRHADHLIAVLTEGYDALARYEESWLDRAALLADDVRAALDWLLGGGDDPTGALRLASLAWWHWLTHGQHAEGRGWLERALAAARDAPPPDRIRALRAAGALTRQMGDVEAAVRNAHSAVSLARELDDRALLAACLNSLGISLTAAGRVADARPHLVEALGINESLGDAHGVGNVLNNLCVVSRATGDHDEAERLNRRAAEVAAAWPRLSAAVLNNAAILARIRGDAAESRALATRALETYHDLEFADGELDCLEAIAIAHALEGDHHTALRLLLLCERQRDALGARSVVVDESVERQRVLRAAHDALGPADVAACAREASGLDIGDVVAQVLRSHAGTAPE